MVGSLTMDSAQYIAGYTLKKMTSWSDGRLIDRRPEFGHGSLRLGRDAMWEVASVLLDLDYDQPDVPSGWRYNGKIWPFGRYLRKELRAMIGRSKYAPQETLEAAAAEVRPVREAAFGASVSFRQTLIDYYSGNDASAESSSRITNKRRTL